jgi:heavy metal response regulator
MKCQGLHNKLAQQEGQEISGIVSFKVKRRISVIFNKAEMSFPEVSVRKASHFSVAFFSVRFIINLTILHHPLKRRKEMRILIIEDEKKVANFIKKGLEEEHYAVDTAHDGETGLYMAEVNEYDLIVLDLMIPKIDGLEVLKRVRDNKNNVPILVLTARDTVEDIIKGLDSGCDDYLTKPFDFMVFLARIRALLRREKIDKEPLLKIADLTLSPITHKIMRGDKEIELTSKEYALLEYFMRNPNRVLTRTMISEHVWDYHFDSMTNVVDVFVNYLRKKIDKRFEPKLIHTVRGVGYFLSTDRQDMKRE